MGTFNGGNDILVAFRGTVFDDLSNWLTDDCVVQKRDSAYPGMVHTGFAQTMYSIWPLINAKLPTPVAGRRVWVTGHSLGAAMATLAALRIEAAGFNAISLYTYGSPRVGNPDFYQAYSVPHYRFVNNCDIVPHVPLEGMLIGVRPYTYMHVGTLEYLDRNGHTWRRDEQLGGKETIHSRYVASQQRAMAGRCSRSPDRQLHHFDRR